jgi:hypothetical protein
VRVSEGRTHRELASLSSNMNKVSLTAEVKALSAGAGVPAGKVTFEMVMPRGMKMAGMHAGVNKLGTAALKGGHASLTVWSSMVLKRPRPRRLAGAEDYSREAGAF